MSAITKMKTAGLIAAALLLAGQATAATITADYINYTGGSVNGEVQVVAPPGGLATVNGGGGGIFEFSRTSSTGGVPALVSNAAGNFIGICLELSETLADPATYNFTSVDAAPINGSFAPPMSGGGKTGGTRADDLRRLLGHVFPDFAGNVVNTTVAGISVNDAKLALQIAVWEIANENYGDGSGGTFGYDLTTGYLRITSANANAFNQAAAWLLALNSGWTPLNNVFAIINTVVPGQDFVVQVVPIPAAAWLLGSGLLGLFGLARRKKAAVASVS
jgi:hypothetical protein